MADVYPLQLRLSVQRETNSVGVRISKKVSLSLLAWFFSSPISFMLCWYSENGHEREGRQ